MVLKTLTHEKYDHDKFAALNDFSIAKNRLGQTEHYIKDLGEIICKYEFNDVLGVALLHKHFPLKVGEKLVREVRDDSITIAPVLVDGDNESKLEPYMWAFSFDMNDECQFLPVEFIKITPAVPGLSERLKSSDTFLKEFGNFVKEHAVFDVFGLSRIPDQFLNKSSTLVLLEEDHPTERLLEIKQVDPLEIKEGETTQTFWSFDRDETGNPIFMKPMACRHCRHCGLHCVIHF